MFLIFACIFNTETIRFGRDHTHTSRQVWFHPPDRACVVAHRVRSRQVQVDQKPGHDFRDILHRIRGVRLHTGSCLRW